MGMLYQRESFGVQNNFTVQCLVITCITILATLSVVSGLNHGIKDLSRIGFGLSMFLLFFVLFGGDTVFQLNLTVQTLGYYIWYLPKIAFHTDAFELLGKQDMGRGGFETQGSKAWMDTWTIFYWGWWISWAPFVGTFMAKISRGRTLRQFVFFTLVAPSIYSFVWFGFLGGEAIKLQTLADGSGLCGVGWLNGGTKATPDSAHCNLVDAEIDATTGKCKDKAGLVAAGLITQNDEANCGRGACSGETLSKGLCGKMLPTCDHYSATYSYKQKQALGIGFNPTCKLESNGEPHPVLSGKCQQFAWERWVQFMDDCVKLTTWVDIPCGSGTDPTALDPSTLACGAGQPNGQASCQDKCKDKITAEMVDKMNPDRMYNHFTPGSVKSTATENIWKDYNEKFGAYEHLDMGEVWVPNSNGVKVFTPPPCFVPAPDNQVCMWNQKTEDVLFDIIGSITHSRGFSDLVCIIALGSLIIYFVTSSDSGSLIVDIMAANGLEEPPIPQRVFWAFTEGACAIALLFSGQTVDGPFGDKGEGGLRALQAASIVMGLPYTFLLFWYSQALVQVCREEVGELDAERPRFKMFLVSLPRSENVTIRRGVLMILRNTFLPGFSKAVRVATETWTLAPTTRGYLWPILLQISWLLALLCCFLGIMEYNVFMMGAAIYFCFAAFLSLVRREIRRQCGIPRGDFVTDYMMTAFAYMLVLTQLEIEMEEQHIVETQMKEQQIAPDKIQEQEHIAPKEIDQVHDTI